MRTNLFAALMVCAAMAVTAARAQFVTPVAATASSQVRPATNTIYAGALSVNAATGTQADDTYFTNDGYFWGNVWNDTNYTLTLTLATNMDLTKIYIWNYANVGNGFQGLDLKNFALLVSTNAAGEDFTQVGGEQTALAPPYNTPIAAQSFSLNATNVRRVRLAVAHGTGADYSVQGDIGLADSNGYRGNYGDPYYVGIGQVRFIPEPSVTLLVGGAALWLLRRRR